MYHIVQLYIEGDGTEIQDDDDLEALLTMASGTDIPLLVLLEEYVEWTPALKG